MTDFAAITATFWNYRPLKSGQMQLIFEVPIERGLEAVLALGGTPKAGESRWCVIALLDPAAQTTGAAHSAPAGAPSRQVPEPTATPVSSIARPDIGTDPGLSVFTGDQFGAGQMPPGPSQDEASAADRARTHKRWADMPASQRAGIMCADPRFWPIMDAADEAEAARFLRIHCLDIASRAELDTNAEARARFEAIETEYLAEIGRIPRP